MKRSVDRILTTHAGSLPRPEALLETASPAAAAVDDAVAAIVGKQGELGIDVVSDGEFGKPSFVSYVNERLGGFEPERQGGARNPFGGSREFLDFPDYYGDAAGAPAAAPHMVCTQPIVYVGQAAVQRDIDRLKRALGEHPAVEAFIPAISPSNIEEWQRNLYYKSDEEYLFAIAEAMREEYRAIIEAGFLLQIDDPRLVTFYTMHPEASVEDCRRWAAVRVEALNHALRGLPEDRIRFHTCYSINIGPRVHDMELKDVVDLILSVHAGAYSLEASNPRHEHEWEVWRQARLPEGKILIPGVVTNSTVMVEHPELVAQRLVRFAETLGRENIMAGTDCGFATFAGSREMPPSVVERKLAALAEGARRASERLWRA